MTQFVDYRPIIHLSQGGCNAYYAQCDYLGKRRKFLIIHHSVKRIGIGHVTQIRKVNDSTFALSISNNYQNWKEYLVPSYLSTYNVTPAQLEELNGGKEVYLNTG